MNLLIPLLAFAAMTGLPQAEPSREELAELGTHAVAGIASFRFQEMASRMLSQAKSEFTREKEIKEDIVAQPDMPTDDMPGGHGDEISINRTKASENEELSTVLVRLEKNRARRSECSFLAAIFGSTVALALSAYVSAFWSRFRIAFLLSMGTALLVFHLPGVFDRIGETSSRPLLFNFVWIGCSLSIVFLVAVLPAYLYFPVNFRRVPSFLLGLIGVGLVGGFMMWPLKRFLEIDPFLPAALATGFIVGVLVPRKIRAEQVSEDFEK